MAKPFSVKLFDNEEIIEVASRTKPIPNDGTDLTEYTISFDIEKEIEKIRQATGFGEVSVNLRVRKKVVDKINLLQDSSRFYVASTEI